jgi:hypothetical protein
VRLEEAQEKARTLDTLNTGLRHERDSFRKVSFLGIKIILSLLCVRLKWITTGSL